MANLKKMDSLIQENKIDYKPSSSLSLCHFNQMREHTPNKPDDESALIGYVAGDVVEIVLNVPPNDFVDGRKSYLQFAVGGSTHGHQWNWATFFTTISSIQLISKDGQVLDTLDKVNMFYSHMEQLKGSRYRSANDSIDDFEGMGASIPSYGFEWGSFNLSKIIPLFNQNNLLPSVLLDGMRIRITVAENAEALNTVFLWMPQTFLLKKFKIMLDTYTMDAKIHEIVAKTPMVIEYETYIHRQQAFAAKPSGCDIDMAVNFSCEKALRAFACCIRPPETTNYGIELLHDAEDAYGFYMDVQWRVDNVYMPARRMSDSTDHLAMCYKAYPTKIDDPWTTRAMTRDNWEKYYSMVAISLTRSPNGNGFTPVNHIELRLRKASIRTQTAHIFVEYIKRIEIKDGKLSVSF